MVQDLKLSHTVNVNKVLLISVLTRWMGFKAFGNCHRYHQHEGGGGGAGGTGWCGCLRNCATSWKVAGSIPDGATGGSGVESVSKIE